jgi:hypothetical protein
VYYRDCCPILELKRKDGEGAVSAVRFVGEDAEDQATGAIIGEEEGRGLA